MDASHGIQNGAYRHQCDLLSPCFICFDRLDNQAESLVKNGAIKTSLAAVVEVVVEMLVEMVVYVVVSVLPEVMVQVVPSTK